MGHCRSDLAVRDCLGGSFCGEINRNDDLTDSKL